MAKEKEELQQEQVQVPQTPQPRPCPQDCRQCGMSQQLFCSTKMLFDLSRSVQEMDKRISVMELTLDDLREQYRQEQNGELSIPFTE